MPGLKIVITGAGGQLGRELAACLAARGDAVTSLGRAELDITDEAQMGRILNQLRPQVVINVAAENRVDECEQMISQAFAVNAVAPGKLAELTHALGASILHVSTDYVFDGTKGAPYLESDIPHPLNIYGMSKLSGEEAVLKRNPKHYIVRSSGLYGAAGSRGKGGNFVETIIRRAQTESVVPVVVDQITSPTYTRDLAEAMAELIHSTAYGLHHLAADGEVSWYDFAHAIINEVGLRAEVRPITSDELGRPARRPAYSVLRSERWPPLRHWREALAAYLIERGHQSLQVMR
jgi:dTDP-4-dehydrorhamnose reductase